MKLYGIEKLSLVDFDGVVASTVFTGSCNFRCPFCHNGPLVKDLNLLKEIDVEKDVFEYLERRVGIIEGVCITGGEPTLQNDLPEFCEKLKKMSLKVKLDTNGTNPQLVKTLAENNLVDYFAMDIKNSKDKYGEIIDVKNYDTSKVEQTVDFFLSHDFPYEFRTTLIKEYHTLQDIIDIGKWIKGANKYFMQKFKQVDTCLSSNLHEIDTITAKEFLSKAQEYVPNSNLRGYDL